MRKDTATLILIFSGIVFLIAYKGINLSQKKEILKKKQARLAVLRSYQNQLSILESQLKILEQKLPELEKLLPANADLPQVAKTLGDFARRSGIKLESLSSSKSASQRKGSFRSWKVYFEGGASDYSNVLLFLKKVKEMERAFYPEDLIVSYNERSGPRLKLNITLSTFIRREK